MDPDHSPQAGHQGTVNHCHSFMGLHFKRTLSAQLHGYKTAPRTMSVHSGHLNTQRKRMLKKRRGQRASYRNKCAFTLSAFDVPPRTFCRLCLHHDVYRHEEAKTTKTKSKAAATRRLSRLLGDPELCVRRSTLRPGILPRGPPGQAQGVQGRAICDEFQVTVSPSKRIQVSV